jgi:hypothetical protein
MVETAEDEVRRLRRRMRSDEMQFPLNGGAEVVEIEIIQIVVEWVFNFLTDLEESQEEERREGSTGDGDPAKLRVNLELEGLEVLVRKSSSDDWGLTGKKRRYSQRDMRRCAWYANGSGVLQMRSRLETVSWSVVILFVIPVAIAGVI